jgi:hypothetical protein
MNTNSTHRPPWLPDPVAAPAQLCQAVPASRGSPRGRHLDSSDGLPLLQKITQLPGQTPTAAATNKGPS